MIQDVGKFIYNEREKQKMSRKELEKRSGVGEKAIQNYENSVSQPRIYDLEAILEVLGYSIEIAEIKEGHEIH